MLIARMMSVVTSDQAATCKDVIVLPVVVMPAVVVVMMPALRAMMMVVVIEARGGIVAGACVVALLNPAPAVPDRTADHADILDQAILAGDAGMSGPRQGLRAASGKGARQGDGGGEQHATHSFFLHSLSSRTRPSIGCGRCHGTSQLRASDGLVIHFLFIHPAAVISLPWAKH